MDISGNNGGLNIAGDRRKSFDICETWNDKRTALVAEPKQVAEVALVFQNMVSAGVVWLVCTRSKLTLI